MNLDHILDLIEQNRATIVTIGSFIIGLIARAKEKKRLRKEGKLKDDKFYQSK